MSRSLALLLIASLIVSVVACGGEPDPPSTDGVDVVTDDDDETAPEDEIDPNRDPFEVELEAAYPAEVTEPTATRRFRLRASDTTLEAIDGRILEVYAYNRQLPGPEFRVTLGEEVEIEFTNALDEPTTVHFHGVRVPNAMDGVPGVTQDPIPPGGTFTYRFTPKDAGTFWFHPHVRGDQQVERGLYGVLVVEDPEPLPYSRDEAWVIDDFRLDESGQIDENFMTPQDLMHDGRWGNVVTVDGDAEKVSSVRPGERFRLRLVNASNARIYLPDFGELEPIVIATDGMYVGEPLPYRGFAFSPGNRLDLDITIPADAEPGTEYVVVDRVTQQPFDLMTFRVEGEPMETPTFEPPSNPNMPKWEGALDRDIDANYVLDARRGGEYGIEWMINGEAWGDHTVTELEGDRWHRIRFQNDSTRLHPMHIHGQFFKVLARDGEPVDDQMFRDTILLNPEETIDIGLVATDWGRWMMHCHILEHAEAGMMTELVVDE